MLPTTTIAATVRRASAILSLASRRRRSYCGAAAFSASSGSHHHYHLSSSSFPTTAVAAAATAAAAAATTLLLLTTNPTECSSSHAPTATTTAPPPSPSSSSLLPPPLSPDLERIDTRLHRAYPEFLKHHLIHQTLAGEDKIEDYCVYINRKDDSIVARAKLGKYLSGHPNIVHGGSIAALLDNTMGVAFFAAKVGNGFTANLSINYKRPILCGSYITLIARVERVEGRKVFLKAEIRDAQDESILFTEATSLFITSQSSLLMGPKKVNIS